MKSRRMLSPNYLLNKNNKINIEMSSIFKYLILPLLLFLAAGAIFFWILSPLWDGAQAAIELKKENENNLVKRKKLTENLDRLIGQYNERVNDFSSLGKAVPAGQNIPEILVVLEALASENGLTFSGIDFKPKESKIVGIKALSMDIRLKGSYPDFQKYIVSMEKSLRLFDVMSVSFNGISPGQFQINPNNLDFNLLVNAYYQ